MNQPLIESSSDISIRDPNLDSKQAIKLALGQFDVKVNLVVMTIFWGVIHFNFYLILFLANTLGSVYKIALMMSFADILSYISATIAFDRIGVKIAFFAPFTLSTLSGILILTYGLSHQDSVAFILFFFTAKFGISFTIAGVYIANAKVFPQEIVATAMGISQLVAHLLASIQFFFTQMD